jgi:hypothetical protein
MFFSISTLMASAACTHSRSLAGEEAEESAVVAVVVDELGSIRPMASKEVAIVLAVYIPPQAPAPGHA